MNWEAIGAIGEVSGAVAVVATLIYLAKQIRQSNKAAETSAIQSFFSTSDSIAVGLGALGGVGRRGFGDWDRLSADDKTAVASYLCDVGSKIHMGFQLWERGVLDDTIYESWESTMVSMLLTRGGAEWWRTAKILWPPDFQQRIDSMLADESKRPPPWHDVLPWYRPDAPEDEGS
jgi:hypothetical protein